MNLDSNLIDWGNSDECGASTSGEGGLLHASLTSPSMTSNGGGFNGVVAGGVQSELVDLKPNLAAAAAMGLMAASQFGKPEASMGLMAASPFAVGKTSADVAAAGHHLAHHLAPSGFGHHAYHHHHHHHHGGHHSAAAAAAAVHYHTDSALLHHGHHAPLYHAAREQTAFSHAWKIAQSTSVSSRLRSTTAPADPLSMAWPRFGTSDLTRAYPAYTWCDGANQMLRWCPAPLAFVGRGKTTWRFT